MVILQDDYQIEVHRFSPGQVALQHALSRYDTGDTNRGIDNGYLAQVMAALKRLKDKRPNANNENRIEGKGITPDVPVDWSYHEVLHSRDNQLMRAVQVAQAL